MVSTLELLLKLTFLASTRFSFCVQCSPLYKIDLFLQKCLFKEYWQTKVHFTVVGNRIEMFKHRQNFAVQFEKK